MQSKIRSLLIAVDCCSHPRPSLTHNANYGSPSSDVLVCFADDSTLGTSENCEFKLQLNLENLFETVILWLDANYLTLNFSKSRFFFFFACFSDLSPVIRNSSAKWDNSQI